MKTILLLPPLLALLSLALPTPAQTLDPAFTPPPSYYASGSVYTVGPAQADGKRLITGEFNTINGTTTGPVVRLDAAGNLDQAFAQNIGLASNVYRVKLLPNGQYLLGSQGGPIVAGGLVRNEVMRLNANGTGDASFTTGAGAGTGYSIDYAVQPDGKVLVSGIFTTYDGMAANYLVRLTATGSLDPTFSVGAGPVSTYNTCYLSALLVQPDGKILVGGNFTQFAGQPATSLVRLLPDGTRDASFVSPLAPLSNVTGLVAQPDGKVLVSGRFGTSNTSPALLRLLPSGSLDTGFTVAPALLGIQGLGFSDPPFALQLDGKIMVIGDFYGASVSHLGRLNADGSQDLTFQATVQPTKSPRSVGVQPDGSVLLGVYYEANVFGTNETTLAHYSSTGTYDASFPTKVQAPATVYAVARPADGSLLVGGNFTEWSGQPVHHLVHLSSGGLLDAGFSARLGLQRGPVKSLLVQPDGKLLVGGTYLGPVRLLATGTPDATFTAYANASYSPAMALQADGKLLVSGFPSGPVNGVIYYGLMRLTSTGAFDPTFVRATTSLGTGRAADAIVVQPDGKIVVASDFYPSGGGTTHAVVRYDNTGAADAGFTPSQYTGWANTTHLYDLALQPDGKLLVGGNFTQAGTLARAGVARLTAAGLPDNTFGAAALLLSGSVLRVAVQPNGRLLLGGDFTVQSPSGIANSFTRLLDTGQLDPSFTASADAPVYSLLVQPNGAIVLGGNFDAINAQASPGVARLLAANVLAVAAPAAVAARTQAWPVPAHGVLHVAPDASAQPLLAELLDALGRLVQQQALRGAAEFTLPVEGLPVGIYMLRVTYAAGVVTRRLAVE